MKEGGVKKTKKRPTTKTQTKPPVLIKHRVDSNPAKAEKAPDLMREGAAEEQNSLSAVLLPSHPTGIPTSTLWEQKKKIIRCCAKQGFYLIPASSLFSKPAKGGGSRSGSQGMGWSQHSRDGEGFFKYGLS